MAKFYLDLCFKTFESRKPRVIMERPEIPRQGEILYNQSVQYRVREVQHNIDKNQPADLGQFPLIIADEVISKQ